LGKSVNSVRYDVLLELLRELRQTAGVSQADVAKRLQQPQTVVSKIERGERRIDFVELGLYLEGVNSDLRSFLDEYDRRLARRTTR
jgi:transcriptional regulator with XRE-family HTH domain